MVCLICRMGLLIQILTYTIVLHRHNEVVMDDLNRGFQPQYSQFDSVSESSELGYHRLNVSKSKDTFWALLNNNYPTQIVPYHGTFFWPCHRWC